MKKPVPEKNNAGIADLAMLNDWRQYQATLSLVLYAAVRRLFAKCKLRIEHSMSQGFYCFLDRPVDARAVARIKSGMIGIIKGGVRVAVGHFSSKRAIGIFNRQNRGDIVALLKNSPVGRINICHLDGLYDTYTMPPYNAVGRAANFDLRFFNPGFILLFPTWHDLTKPIIFMPQPKLSRIFNEYIDWINILGVANVADLNEAVAGGRGPEIIRVSEALHEKKIGYIADRIKNEKRKIVLIAGPSSAGKTTFTKRLAVQLQVNELKPEIISVDDYFFPHRRTPRDESGALDFESIDAVDTVLLNRHLETVIRGFKVRMPRFNFLNGRREPGRWLSLPPNGVLLVEGIHCLNEDLTKRIPKPVKFKIYISALTQLNLDDHNRISTTDTRMVRRIIRDTQYRGYTPQGVLLQWGKVRSGEERNIYPFQEEADEMFNSALIYEPSVLKEFCEPVLRLVPPADPTYREAKRLLDYFSFFYPLANRDVPSNSIIREFTGGSSFVY